MAQSFELLIRPRKGWQPIEFREIWAYRELLAFLVWRDIKIRYRQTVLGGLWAIIQPLIAMIVFTLLFHRAAGIRSDGPPYPLFAFAGLVPWTFFSGGVTAASNSLVGNQQLISKIYFPRIFIPLGSIGALLADMLISLGLMAGLMAYYHWPVSPRLILLPLFVLGSVLGTAGLGFILSGLNVRFRDIKYAVPFFVQMGLFVTPVIYPVGYVPMKYRLVLGLNPIAGMVEGFRYSLLASPVMWGMIVVSLVTSLGLLIAGLFFFRRVERLFADII
jgi:lipopolysaccharide transport system permease protein